MNRSEVVLGALAAASGAGHSPVQVQKLFFLIDEKIPHLVGGRHFAFLPKDYGPFDKEVYTQLEQLALSGDVAITEGRVKSYQLTSKGQLAGEQVLADMDKKVSDYIRYLSGWVRSLSFADLVTSIYKEFPGMRVNSVFREY